MACGSLGHWHRGTNRQRASVSRFFPSHSFAVALLLLVLDYLFILPPSLPALFFSVSFVSLRNDLFDLFEFFEKIIRRSFLEFLCYFFWGFRSPLLLWSLSLSRLKSFECFSPFLHHFVQVHLRFCCCCCVACCRCCFVVLAAVAVWRDRRIPAVFFSFPLGFVWWFYERHVRGSLFDLT